MNLVVVDGKMKIELNVEAVVTMHVNVHVDEETKTSCRAKNASTYMCVQVHLWVFNMDACRRKIYQFITSMYLSTKVAAKKVSFILSL